MGDYESRLEDAKRERVEERYPRDNPIGECDQCTWPVYEHERDRVRCGNCGRTLIIMRYD